MGGKFTADNEYIQPVLVIGAATDAGGDSLPVDFDSSAETYAYNGSGQMTTVTRVASDGHTYVQTFTYSGSNLLSVSQWVRTA